MPRTNKNDSERIDQLLSMLWSSKSKTRTKAIADQILEINPHRVEALIIKSDTCDNARDMAKFLEKALSALKAPKNFAPDDRNLLFLTINQRLAWCYMTVGQSDKAFKACETAVKFMEEHAGDESLYDEKNNTLVKALYYRLLIDRKEWQKILSEAMRDSDITLARAYAKLIAAWCMSKEKARSVCASLFWDVLTIAPDVPFYMFGYFEEPDENAEPEADEDFNFALMYYDVIKVSQEFYDWFTRGVILFGLLSGRFDEREEEYMIDALDSLGGFDEYERMKNILVETEDSIVIETLAANKCLVD
ncbi:MAG: hypothetical protein IJU31_03625 [Synergistaceae bacterium]|nr:hypothetical protein [Synergistaceae bacterium]